MCPASYFPYLNRRKSPFRSWQRLFKITTVYHGSPAEIAGLKTDDLIVAVDGDLATTMTEEQIYAKLRGNFGTTTRLKVRRDNDTSDITIIRGIVPNWSLFIGLRSQNYLQFSSARTRGMTQIDLLSLDWPDVADLIDDYITGMNEHDACILDLRGCQGDPETAARVAARFIDQGEVLRYICREGNKTVEVAYRVDNRVLWRSTGIGTSTGVTSHQDKIEELPHLYENRLVVVINGRTRGAAESLAIALQRDGATLVGSGTAGDFVVCDTESFGEGDAKLFLQIPACTLKGVAGSRLSSVDPDRRVIVADPLTEAKKEVAGVYWYNDVEFILYGVMGIIALVVLFLFYRGAKRAQTEQLKAAQATKDQGMASGSNVSTPTATEPGAAADGAEAGTEADPAVEGGNIKPVHVAPSPDTLVSDNQIASETSSSPKSDLRLRLLGYLIGFTIGALMLGLLIFIGYNKNSAPSGARSQVIVEFYTDGSEKSAQQAEVVEQLKREYDGPIEFRTFDVRQHPNFAPTYDGEQIEKVDRIPMIRVRYQWVGKDGKRISSGASWGGARTKRDLVEDIERAETNLNYQYRITEKIVRHKGRR
ncbi:MAG: PDZ domain-containing protein [Candidatus Obscuribacterales bacterium]|nr:PDZ domain-containing protein [Candidatus Obscuribacterales bacterium]